MFTNKKQISEILHNIVGNELNEFMLILSLIPRRNFYTRNSIDTSRKDEEKKKSKH